MEKIVTRFAVISDAHTPSELTAAIGIAPDKVWEKGTIRENTAILEENSGWSVVDEWPVDCDLDEAIRKHLSRVVAAGPRIRKLDGVHRELSVVIYSRETPALSLSAEAIRSLGDVGGSIDFDIYPG
jgi:hypothetical protein